VVAEAYSEASFHRRCAMVKFLRGQWSELQEMVDGFSIMYMEGLLLVPLVMAGMFYPVQVLIGVGVGLAVSVAAFETAVYVRHHRH
jgi:hypothetical protein